MTASTIIIAKKKRKISWENFKIKYLSREDNYKYEWVDGYVEKTRRIMDDKQLFILENIFAFFDKIKAENSIDGRLISEVDTFFAGKHRRPDISFFTRQQIKDARTGSNKIPPQFLIEIISSTDQINRVQRKMQNYLKAKVKVVWHIFPEFKMVHVYTGKKMLICKEADICSANSVIKGFEISADDIFKES